MEKKVVVVVWKPENPKLILKMNLIKQRAFLEPCSHLSYHLAPPSTEKRVGGEDSPE